MGDEVHLGLKRLAECLNTVPRSNILFLRMERILIVRYCYHMKPLSDPALIYEAQLSWEKLVAYKPHRIRVKSRN